MLQFLSFLKSWKQEKKQPQRNPKKEVTQLVLETRSRKPGQWKACRRRLGRGEHALVPVTASCPQSGVTASVPSGVLFTLPLEYASMFVSVDPARS